MNLVPDNFAFHLEARQLDRVDEGLLDVPSGKAENGSSRFQNPVASYRNQMKGDLSFLIRAPVWET